MNSRHMIQFEKENFSLINLFFHKTVGFSPAPRREKVILTSTYGVNRRKVNKRLFVLGMSVMVLFRLLESRTPNHLYGQALYHLGEDYLHKNKAREALRYFHRAVKYNPNLPPAYNDLARIYYEQKKYDEAIYQAELAVSFDPQFHPGYHTLGLIYRAQGDDKRAIQYFKRAAKLYSYGSFRHMCFYDIAISSIHIGDYKEAGNMIRDLKDLKEFKRAESLEAFMAEQAALTKEAGQL